MQGEELNLAAYEGEKARKRKERVFSGQTSTLRRGFGSAMHVSATVKSVFMEIVPCEIALLCTSLSTPPT